MDGMTPVANHKIKSASLLEVVVALVVIFAVFAIATSLYINVISSSANLQQSRLGFEIERLASETKRDQSWIDSKIEIGNYVVEKTVKPYQNRKGVVQLGFVARNANQKVVIDWKELYLMER